MAFHDSENGSENTPDEDPCTASKFSPGNGDNQGPDENGEADFDEMHLVELGEIDLVELDEIDLTDQDDALLDNTILTPSDGTSALGGDAPTLAGNEFERVISEQLLRDQAEIDALEPTPDDEWELEPIPADDYEDEQPIPSWLARLHPMIPDELFAPFNPSRQRFCFRKFGSTEHCGLIVFSEKAGAVAYAAAYLACHGFNEVIPVTFDRVFDVAQSYHWRVDCVALIDNPRQPVFQAVR